MIDDMLGVRLQALADADKPMQDRTPEYAQCIAVIKAGFLLGPLPPIPAQERRVGESPAIDLEFQQQIFPRFRTVRHARMGSPRRGRSLVDRFRGSIHHAIARMGTQELPLSDVI